MEEMDQENGQGAPYLALDSDGNFKTALLNAPPYMQTFYDLIKSAHDRKRRCSCRAKNFAR